MFKGKIILLLLITFWGFSCRNNPSVPPSEKASSLEEKSFPKSQEQILSTIQQQGAKLNLCEGAIDENISTKMSSVYPLADNKYLVEFLCFLGAYQGNYQYFIYENTENSQIHLLTLDDYYIDESGEIKPEKVNFITGLPTYNSEEKTLVLLTKYRGLGDCGSLAKYKLQENKLKLLEYRIKKNCDGVYLDPEKYSRIYP